VGGWGGGGEYAHITEGKLSSKVYLGLCKANLERTWTAHLQLWLGILI